jgi:hypothetical protein
MSNRLLFVGIAGGLAAAVGLAPVFHDLYAKYGSDDGPSRYDKRHYGL